MAVHVGQAHVTDVKCEMDCYQKIAVLSRFSNVITTSRYNLAVILIVATYIFVELLQFINQRMHI